MALIYETAYPRLKSSFTDKELELNFTPTEDDLLLMKLNTKRLSIVTQLGFLVTLKCYQCLGRPILTKKASPQIKFHIAKKINIENVQLTEYDRSSARKRHIKSIRKYLCVSEDKQARRTAMKKIVISSSETKENLADIINDIIEELVRLRFELPIFRILLRLSMAARKVVSNHHYEKVNALLSKENIEFIENLFKVTAGVSQWNQLKQEPKSPTANNVKIFIEQVNQLKKLKEKININIDFVSVNRISQYVSEAISLDASNMRDLKPSRRYFLAIILIIFKASSAMDDLISIFIRWIRKLHTDGKESLNHYRLTHASETDDLVCLLHRILTNLKVDATAPERLCAIESCVTQGVDEAIAQCEKHIAYSNDNYFSFMLKPYRNKRYLILNLLDQLDIKSSSQDISIEAAINFIKIHRNSNKVLLDIKYNDEQDRSITLDLSWLPEKWFKAVTGKTKGSQVYQIDRKYFELAVLSVLVDELDCGDVYVSDADIYNDQNKNLIDWDQFHQTVEEYCTLNKLPYKSDDFVIQMQNELRETAYKVDDSYHKNEYLSIEKNEPVIKKHLVKEKPVELEMVREHIADRMPLTNIVDVITDVEKWINLSVHFKPLSGYETKIEDYNLRFVSTSFAYGCNIGPTQAARSLQKFSRKQISWLFNHHMTEEKIDKASTKVINLYNKFALPKKWGTGESLSADATYVDIYEQNLIAEHHIRYGNYGGLAYFHVSDLYIALFGNFISCGVHESNYIFDGIEENGSELKPNKVHGDTGAQNEVVFGFSKLLAIQLLPRIRNFKHLRYYKACKEDKYVHIESIFTDETIDWEIIKTHYNDMLRIVMSIRTGKIKASTILRRLRSKSRKNKIYFAFRELGRVVRTIFLLNYINDIELRRVIQAATCKSEEFNDFIAWIRFGDGGVIADNMRYDQRKIIKYGRLVANMVILHVVANMTKVVNDLRKEEVEIEDNVLPYLSPYRTEHLNRFGTFLLDMDRETIELQYDLLNKTSEK